MINLDISRLTGGIFWVLLGLTLAGCTPDETALSEDVDPQRVEADTVLLGGVVASMRQLLSMVGAPSPAPSSNSTKSDPVHMTPDVLSGILVRYVANILLLCPRQPRSFL